MIDKELGISDKVREFLKYENFVCKLFENKKGP